MEAIKQLALVNGQHVQVLTHEDEVYVPIRPICDILGVNYSTQLEKIKNDPLKSKGTVPLRGTVGADGKQREMVALKFKYALTWMLSINANNVKEEIREHLMEYQDQCSDILCDYFLNAGKISKLINSEEIQLKNELKKLEETDALSKRKKAIINKRLKELTDIRLYGGEIGPKLFTEENDLP
ncbi:MAG: phage antirepressor N-terminal domain-containing protein [Enterobacteriaceae bacterium]